MSIMALLHRAKQLPPAPAKVAESVLRRLRITRIMTFGPQGGGKTTSITACARTLGRCSILSFDQDVKPVLGCDLLLMPEPFSRVEIPNLVSAVSTEVYALKKAFGTPAESHIVLLDTITTLHTWLSVLSVEADATGMAGMNQEPMEFMREMGKISRVCVAWAHSVWRLGTVAAANSFHDGPMIFAVTEHAKEASKGEISPRFTADGKQIVDLAFGQWVPRIARAAGHQLEQEVDLCLAYSVDGKPDAPMSLLCDSAGGHTKGRFTPPEWDIFRAAMKGKAPDRLADALTQIYTRRKQLWLHTYSHV